MAITLLEPPLAAMTAWIIFGETFILPQWGGFAPVLFSLLMFARRTHAA